MNIHDHFLSLWKYKLTELKPLVSCPADSLLFSRLKKNHHGYLHPSTTYLCIPRQYRVIFKFYINIILNLCNTDTVPSDTNFPHPPNWQKKV